MLGQAIDNLKASAAGIQRGSKPAETQPAKFETLPKSSKSQSSSGLPPNFFENPEPPRGNGLCTFFFFFFIFFLTNKNKFLSRRIFVLLLFFLLMTYEKVVVL